MGDWDQDNADYHGHYGSGLHPDVGASEAAWRGYRDYQKWDADMAKVLGGQNTGSSSSSSGAGDSDGGDFIEFVGAGIGIGVVISVPIYAYNHSETFKYVVDTGAHGIAVAAAFTKNIIVAVVNTQAAQAVGTGIKETIVTGVNNYDLVAAGAVGMGIVHAGMYALLNCGKDRYVLNTRGVTIKHTLATALAAAAILVTGAQVRKAGYVYEVGWQQSTDIGAAITNWNRPPKGIRSSYTVPTVTPVLAKNEPIKTVTALPVPDTSKKELKAPPHKTRAEMEALLAYLKNGGDLTDSQMRELWDKGIRFRKVHGDQSTLRYEVPYGYFGDTQESQRGTGTALSADQRLLNRTPPSKSSQAPWRPTGTALSADPRLLGR